MFPLFQRIPHLAGSRTTPDDLLMTSEEQEALLQREVYVCEKLDGLAVSVYRRNRRSVHWGVRPFWEAALDGQIVSALEIYMQQRLASWFRLLQPGMAMFGEWVGHTITTHYEQLPDYFVCYALRRSDGTIDSLDAMRERCALEGLTSVSPIWKGKPDSLEMVVSMAGLSQFGEEPMEGLIVEPVEQGEQAIYGKWVAPHYLRLAPNELTGRRNELARRVWATGGARAGVI